MTAENVTRIKSEIMITVGECENPKEQNTCKKNYIWNPTTCTCENVEYLTNTIDDSMITCDEIINESANVMSTVSSNFH